MPKSQIGPAMLPPICQVSAELVNRVLSLLLPHPNKPVKEICRK
ncbi:hypothetical protein [Rickettsia endosymbiont of Proechinophthirus fluctus]|nr:hypothetical protein [Rickettsia endosymbiont of Proechinophthirus fluctus]